MFRAALAIACLSLNGCTFLYAGLNDKITVEQFEDMVDRAPYVIPANVSVMTGQEIREQIIGNTLTGPSPGYGPVSVEYLHPDGTVAALWRDRLSTGMWGISRSLLCIYYPLVYLRQNWPPREESLYHCFTLSLDGDTVHFHDQNGRLVEIASLLLPGNARDLPLNAE